MKWDVFALVMDSLLLIGAMLGLFVMASGSYPWWTNGLVSFACGYTARAAIGNLREDLHAVWAQI